MKGKRDLKIKYGPNHYIWKRLEEHQKQTRHVLSLKTEHHAVHDAETAVDTNAIFKTCIEAVNYLSGGAC